MFDLVAFGELIIDFAPKGVDKYGYPLLQAQAGGAPANLLSAFCKYGGKGAIIGKVGDDVFGKLMINSLKSTGADVSGVMVDNRYFTTMAFVTLDETGDRSFSFARKPGADVSITFDEVDLSLIDNGKIFHFSTLSMTDEPGRDTTFRLAQYAKETGKLISYDPNLRLNLWKNEAEAKEFMLKGFEYADIVKISDNEVEFLWGCSPSEGADIIMSNFNTKLVYVTMGKNGCYFCNKNTNGYTSAPRGIQAVDTTGAGDIFSGSAMAQLLKAGKNPQDLNGDDMVKICSFACAAASLSTMENGGFTSVPDIETVNKYI